MLLPRTIANVGRVAATESHKYGMRNVQIARDAAGRPTVTATDGKRLLTVAVTDEYFCEICLETDFSKAVSVPGVYGRERQLFYGLSRGIRMILDRIKRGDA